MKLSIIICTYNSSKTLPKTLNSILTQSYDDYEVLAIDGLSSDGTIEIIKSYEKKFNGKLRFISEKDSGVYEAMNKGIDLAKGDWIYFLGSDDVFYSKNVLERISKEIEKSDWDVVYGNVKWGETEKIYDGEFSRLKLMSQNICHQAIFFRRSIFQKFGKFEIKYKALADYVFNMKWFNDKNVKREYVELVVAKYNTAGLSANIQDEEFEKNRSRIIEQYFPKEYSKLNKKRELSGDVDEVNEEIRELKKELKFIKSSKFWKMRNRYMRLKSLSSFKNHG